jgi:hypothetical protein
MSDNQWEREYATQTDYLAAQLLALAKRPIQRRKQFINHEIHCKGCHIYTVEDPHVLTLVQQIFAHIAPDGSLAPDPPPKQ